MNGFTRSVVLGALAAVAAITMEGVADEVGFPVTIQSGTLSVTPDTHQVSAVAGSTVFMILTAEAWTIEEEAAWLTVSLESGAGPGPVQVYYTDNTGPARSAVLTVTGADTIPASVPVTINQAMRALYSGGAGTESDPYQIGNVTDWVTLTAAPEDWASHFRLVTDIDFAGEAVLPIAPNVAGSYIFQGTPFSGVFDGGGHVLRNIVVNLPDDSHVGLFGFVASGGVLMDLGVEQVTTTGNEFVGGLAGMNEGSITRCRITGTVTVAGQSGYGGGLAGYNNGGAIESCHTACEVTCDTMGCELGGLAGINYTGTIVSCYAMGPVTAPDFSGYVGGLVGYNMRGSILFSYAIGSVYYGGGLVGSSNSGTVTGGYWDTETSGRSSSEGGEGRSTDEMTSPYAENTYVDWNFETVWAEDADFSINDGYPYLRDCEPLPAGEGEPVEGEPVEGEPLSVHPGDLDSDWRLVMGEAIAYLAGWQQGGNPMAYAIRAAYLWQNGEHYTYVSGIDPPLCWILEP